MRKRCTVSAELVRIFKGYMAQKGVTLNEHDNTSGVDRPPAGEGDGRIPLETFLAIWESASEQVGRETMGIPFGKDLASHYPFGNVLWAVMLNASTLGEALSKLCKYHDIMADFYRPSLSVTDGLACLSFEGLDTYAPIPREMVEAILSAYVLILYRLTQGSPKPVEIRFQLDQPSSLGDYREVFGTALRFSYPRSEIVFRKEHLNTEILLSDRNLFNILEDYAQTILDNLDRQEAWPAKVAQVVARSIVLGKTPDVRSVARDLGVSVRSLQSRLKKEGKSYRTLLGEVRKELAQDYLERTDMEICELALLLGYSDQSAFTNAFKRWTGRTPRSLRAMSKNSS